MLDAQVERSNVGRPASDETRDDQDDVEGGMATEQRGDGSNPTSGTGGDGDRGDQLDA